MRLKPLIAALLLGVTLPVAAQVATAQERYTIQDAYEVDLSTVRLPQIESGTIRFKACRACDFQTTRVTPETRWLVNGQVVPFRKFQEVIAALDNRNAEHLTIKHHLKKDQITKVSISIR